MIYLMKKQSKVKREPKKLKILDVSKYNKNKDYHTSSTLSIPKEVIQNGYIFQAVIPHGS